MCVSLAPAKFSKTIVYAGESIREGRVVHVLGYQNVAQNLAGSGSPSASRTDFWKQVPGDRPRKGNALLLAVPAQGTLSKVNDIDTSSCPSVLKDMREALTPRTRGGGMMGEAKSFSANVSVYTSGIYTVVTSDSAEAIPEALALVPEEKRPELNREIFTAFERLYPGWQYLLACFNNDEPTEAHPFMLWFEPIFPGRLYLPALDAHDGRAPNLEAEVEVDHTLVVSANGLTKGMPVRYGRGASDISGFIPHRVMGRSMSALMSNGDFGVLLDEVRAGVFNPLRVSPPGV